MGKKFAQSDRASGGFLVSGPLFPTGLRREVI